MEDTEVFGRQHTTVLSSGRTFHKYLPAGDMVPPSEDEDSIEFPFNF